MYFCVIDDFWSLGISAITLLLVSTKRWCPRVSILSNGLPLHSHPIGVSNDRLCKWLFRQIFDQKEYHYLGSHVWFNEISCVIRYTSLVYGHPDGSGTFYLAPALQSLWCSRKKSLWHSLSRQKFRFLFGLFVGIGRSRYTNLYVGTSADPAMVDFLSTASNHHWRATISSLCSMTSLQRTNLRISMISGQQIVALAVL